jgi:exosortase A-associated hydrolase 2
MEQAGFFQSGDRTLFAVLHEPAAPSRPLGFVLSHPFGEEKLWAHRVFVSFARALAARGHAVLRFDYSGAGDSGGAFAASSLDSHVADLEAAVAHLQARAPSLERIGLVGLRFGATIAALAAERAGQANRGPVAGAPLVLWDPLIDGDAWLGEMLRSHLSTQLATHGKVIENRDALRARIARGEAVNLDGYDLAAPLFDSCNRKDLLPPTTKSHGGITLVMQIAANENQKTRADLEALGGAYTQGQYQRCIEEPFWKEIRTFYGRAPNLERLTLEWLEKTHAAV